MNLTLIPLLLLSLPLLPTPPPPLLLSKNWGKEKSLFHFSRTVMSLLRGCCMCPLFPDDPDADHVCPLSESPPPAPPRHTCEVSAQRDEPVRAGMAVYEAWRRSRRGLPGKQGRGRDAAPRGLVRAEASCLACSHHASRPAVAPQRPCAAALTFLAAQDPVPFPNLLNNRQILTSAEPMALEQTDPIKRPS